jgi:rod shape-determining protein MreD
MKKYIFSVLILYFLILFQTGFLNFLKISPNFVLLAILLLVIFEKKGENLGLFSAILGGFFLDIFSHFPVGVVTLSLISVYFVSKTLLRIFLKVNFLETALIIILGTFFYNFLTPSFNYLSGFVSGSVQPFQFNFSYLTLIGIISNLVLGTIGFYLLKYYGVFKPVSLKRVK